MKIENQTQRKYSNISNQCFFQNSHMNLYFVPYFEKSLQYLYLLD